MEPTRIIAIRHGETPWNVDKRIQGHIDIPLNDTGLRQARLAAQALAGEAIQAIYSSDLARARATAEAVARPHGLPVRPHAGLRERQFGRFEGLTFTEIDTSWPEQALHWRKRTPHWEPPEGGESLLALRERVGATLQALAERHPGEQIVVVAHGGVLDALYRLATGQPVDAPRTWELPNAAINRVLWTPQGFTLVGWSDTLHLDQAAADEQTA